MKDEAVNGTSSLLLAPVAIDRAGGCLHIDPVLPAALFELADRLCKSIARKPKRKRRRTWTLGIPGSPSGRFIVVPWTRATTDPSQWPAIEPTGLFHIMVSLENDDLEEIRASVVVGVNERSGRIIAVPKNQRDDIHIVAALERTLVAIARQNFALVKRQDLPECIFCTRGLNDPISRDVGYGPCCARRYGLAHRDAADAEHRGASDQRRRPRIPQMHRQQHPKATIYDRHYVATRVRLVDHGRLPRWAQHINIPYAAYRLPRKKRTQTCSGALLIVEGWETPLIVTQEILPPREAIEAFEREFGEQIATGAVKVVADYRDWHRASQDEPQQESQRAP